MSRRGGGSACAGRETALPEAAGRALKLLGTARTPEAVEAAVSMLNQRDPQLRQALLARYAYLDHEPSRRDPGTYVRSALLRALRAVATAGDVPLLLEAATRTEFLPPDRQEVAAILRGAALVTLAEVAPDLAGYHATRLLVDGYTSKMSGEPAVTAVHVLAAQGEVLALYGYLIRPQPLVDEVIAEALRGMADAPAPIVHELVDLYGAVPSEALLLGLFDLLLGRRDSDAHQAYLLGFLRESELTDLCRYLAAAIVAGRNQRLIEGLRGVAAQASGTRADVLGEALAIIDG